MSENDAVNLLNQNGKSIGRAISAMKSKKSGTYQMAVDYLYLAENGSLYELIATTAPLEKERVKASEFFGHFPLFFLFFYIVGVAVHSAPFFNDILNNFKNITCL